MVVERAHPAARQQRRVVVLEGEVSRLAAAKVVFEILKLGAEVFGIVEDKAMARRQAKQTASQDARIAELERKLAELQEPRG